MNYLEIVVQGYFNENNKDFLEKYFFREFKIAEKEQFYEANEFFNGCLKVITGWEKNLQDQVSKRKNELYLMLNGAKNGTLSYDNMDGKTIDRKWRETIECCEQELKDLRPGGIVSRSFNIKLYSLPNGRFAHHLVHFELLQIKHAIIAAFKKTSMKNETLPPGPKSKTAVEVNLFNDYFKGNAFILFKKYIDDNNIDATCRTALRVLFELFKEQKLFTDTCELKHYLKFLSKYMGYNSLELKKVEMNTTPNILRTNDFNKMKDNLKITLK